MIVTDKELADLQTEASWRAEALLTPEEREEMRADAVRPLRNALAPPGPE